MGALGKIFGFGDSLKRRLRDAVSNPSDYAQMTADQNQNEWSRNPDERSMGFFNPAPLGTMGNFQLRKELVDALPNLSRRDFMKKSAGIAGGTAAMSIPGAKLLSKFAPEEKTALKEANVAKQIAVESAPKYKYNSLKDYLDYVETSAYSAHDNPIDYQMFGEDASSIPNLMKQRLLQDEAAYKQAKDYKQWAGHPEMDYMTKEELAKVHQSIDKQLNAFSPQAKQEMKDLKSLTKQIDMDFSGYHDWTEWLVRNTDNPTEVINTLKNWYNPVYHE